MNIAVMTVNDFDFHPNGRLRQEARKMGHDIRLINPYSMGCCLDNNTPNAFFSGSRDLPDLVMPRQGSPMGEYGFVLLNQFAALKIAMVNSIEGITIARNQFITLQRLASTGLPVADSCFVVDRDNFFTAVLRLGGYPLVAKQVDGMGGDGVVKLNNRSEADCFIEQQFNPKKGIVLQVYIPTEGRQDMRMLVIADRVAGAMTLTPPPGSFKSNVHQEASAVCLDPDPALARMAVQAARACCLEVAGVDMMQDAQGRLRIGEVNYSPGFRGLEQATGLNIAGQILEYALEKIKEGRR